MMLTLGFFVFERRTLPYQSLKHDASYTWGANERIGQRGAYQFTGIGEESVSLTGTVYSEMTGGKVSLYLLRLMAESGVPWPLLDGNGIPYGIFVITKVSETGTEHLPDGTARKIDFTVELKRVDESLVIWAENKAPDAYQEILNIISKDKGL